MSSMTKTPWWGAMSLAGVLLALPVAADPEKCEADCASKTSEVMQECVLKCPQPSNPANTRAYQSCAVRCSGKQQERFDTCARRCDSAKGESSGKKKGKR